jgi:hypothetical protein
VVESAPAALTSKYVVPADMKLGLGPMGLVGYCSSVSEPNPVSSVDTLPRDGAVPDAESENSVREGSNAIPDLSPRAIPKDEEIEGLPGTDHPKPLALSPVEVSPAVSTVSVSEGDDPLFANCKAEETSPAPAVNSAIS